MEGFRLYELDQAISAVINLGFVVDEETGEILFDAENLEELEAAREAKLEGCAIVIKQLEAEAALIRAEEIALAERRKAKERKAERMREYVAASMLAADEMKLETPRCALSFRRSEAVEIVDVAALPAEYWKQADPTPDKTAIKKALKAGEDVDGAQIVTKFNIQVR